MKYVFWIRGWELGVWLIGLVLGVWRVVGDIGILGVRRHRVNPLGIYEGCPSVLMDFSNPAKWHM